VPNRIVIAFVAELRLYGFWGREGCFAELLRILENEERIGLLAASCGSRLLPNLRDEFGYEVCRAERWAQLLPN
jgi:hypothetical protein